MSSSDKPKRRKYAVFLFPEERRVGHDLTAKIVAGEVAEGSYVSIKWKNQEVPAKILRLAGMIFFLISRWKRHLRALYQAKIKKKSRSNT